MKTTKSGKNNNHIVLVPARLAGDDHTIIVEGILPIDRKNPYVEVFLSTNDSEDSSKKIQYHYAVGVAKTVPSKAITKIALHKVIRSDHVEYKVGYIPQNVGYKQSPIISKGNLLFEVREALGIEQRILPTISNGNYHLINSRSIQKTRLSNKDKRYTLKTSIKPTNPSPNNE